MKYRFHNKDRSGKLLAPIIWDPASNSAMAEFVDGKFITDVDRVADQLMDMGYCCEKIGDNKDIEGDISDLEMSAEDVSSPMPEENQQEAKTSEYPIFIDSNEQPAKRKGRPPRQRQEMV